MIPTVAQQLRSIKLRLTETIIPALPADARFAQEQAGLMVATLDWLLDTHEHQYRYEVVENVEYRRLLAELAEGDEATPTDDATLAEVRDTLSEPGPSPHDAAMALGDLADQNRRLKELTRRVFAALSAVPSAEAAQRARALLAEVANRQGERELAWFRMTGFPQAPGEIAAVLAGGADAPEAEPSHRSSSRGGPSAASG